MKIKAVCEATGLSDRAVRYYIEEGLISPSFSENYLGRRTFDFSGEDVRALERIAVLRRYDFSVDEIRLMTARPDTIEAICAALISRKRESIANDSDALSSLERTLEEHPKSLEELVSALSAPKAPLPKEDSAHFFPNKAVNILLTVVCVLPVVEAAIMFILAIKEYRYTVFNALSVIIVCACLIPSILSFILPRVLNGSKARFISKAVLSDLCLAALLPIFIAGLVLSFRSETNNSNNYLRFDDHCLALQSDEFFDIFPSRTEFIMSKPETRRYHYCDCETYFGQWSDIFAELKLSEKDFEDELSSQKKWFDAYYNNHAEDWTVYSLKYESFTHGRFYCIALYTKAPPFDDYHESRDVFLFAYDPEERIVRYAFYESNDYNEDLPFFTTLDW